MTRPTLAIGGHMLAEEVPMLANLLASSRWQPLVAHDLEGEARDETSELELVDEYAAAMQKAQAEGRPFIVAGHERHDNPYGETMISSVQGFLLDRLGRLRWRFYEIGGQDEDGEYYNGSIRVFGKDVPVAWEDEYCALDVHGFPIVHIRGVDGKLRPSPELVKAAYTSMRIFETEVPPLVIT